MADKLKRCPFCGGEASIYHGDDTDGYIKGTSYVMAFCGWCGASIRGKNEDEVIKKWNNRPSPWHTGTPTEKEIDKDNQYCYALCFYYDGWWLSDYLFKANHEEGCFENSPNNGQQVCKFSFCDNIAWQKIDSYKED